MAAAQPDLSGQVILITGANSGIGKEAAVQLAAMGATVVITARDRGKGEAALAEVQRRSGSDGVELGDLDLASFASVRGFADDVLDRHDRLDVLMNNAGLVLDRRLLTDEGHEMTFGVNHLGPFLLTSLLRARLEASAPARVVNVASFAHRAATAAGLRADPQSEQLFTAYGAYGKSKLANILFTRELARRLAGTGVTANSLHPGAVRSGFGIGGDTHGPLAALMWIGRPFLVSAKRAARTQVQLAADPELADVSGEYFVRGQAHRPSPDARDDAAARWLWEESERLIAAAADR